MHADTDLRNVAVEVQDVQHPLQAYIDQSGKASNALIKWAWTQGGEIEQFISAMNTLENKENAALHQYILEYNEFYRAFQSLLLEKKELHELESEYLKVAKKEEKWLKRERKRDTKFRTTPIGSAKTEERSMKLEDAHRHVEEAGRDREYVDQQLHDKILEVQQHMHDVLREKYYKLCVARVKLLRKSMPIQMEMLEKVNALPQVLTLEKDGFTYAPYPERLGPLPDELLEGFAILGEEKKEGAMPQQFAFNLKPRPVIENARESLMEQEYAATFCIRQARQTKILLEYIMNMVQLETMNQFQRVAATVNLTTHISNLLISAAGTAFAAPNSKDIIPAAKLVAERSCGFLDGWAEEAPNKEQSMNAGNALKHAIDDLIEQAQAAEEREKEKRETDAMVPRSMENRLDETMDTLKISDNTISTLQEQLMPMEQDQGLKAARLNVLRTSSETIGFIIKFLRGLKIMEADVTRENEEMEGGRPLSPSYRKSFLEMQFVLDEISKSQSKFLNYLENVISGSGSYEELQVISSGLSAYADQLTDACKRFRYSGDSSIKLQTVECGEAAVMKGREIVDAIRECMRIVLLYNRDTFIQEKVPATEQEKLELAQKEVEKLEQTLMKAQQNLEKVRMDAGKSVSDDMMQSMQQPEGAPTWREGVM